MPRNYCLASTESIRLTSKLAPCRNGSIAILPMNPSWSWQLAHNARRQLQTQLNMNHTTPLEQCVRQQLERYFVDLGESEPRDMLAMVIDCVERPVLQVAMERANGNQTKAAEMLGITRSTLRKKLLAHKLQPNSNY